MHDSASTEHEQFPGDYLSGEVPCHLLIVGELPQSLLRGAPAGVSIYYLTTLDEAENQIAVEATDDNKRQDETERVLVLNVASCDEPFEQCLGRAVRAFPHRVLVHSTCTVEDPGWADEAYFALGFRKLRVEQDGVAPGVMVKWFEYRLSQYKPSPDWLNARFWANPERFDRDDDPDGYCEESEDDYEDEEGEEE